MKKIDKIIEEIKVNTEVLEVLPKNNIKNRKLYLEKIVGLKKEYEIYLEKVEKEIEKRVHKFNEVIECDDQLKELQDNIEQMDDMLITLNPINTSYEKMKLDRQVHNLTYYYKKNLEIVNDTIAFCAEKFSKVGIDLSKRFICYSQYVDEYLQVFFNPHSTDKDILNRFDEIFWKCPDIITHIELNIKYLYFKFEKEIDKYYKNEIQKLLQGKAANDIYQSYQEAKKEIIQQQVENVNGLIKKFANGELNYKNFSKDMIEKSYLKFVSKETFHSLDEQELNELDINLGKLANSLYEYKYYLKYQFIFNNLKEIYKDKDKYKAGYLKTKKIIEKNEKRIIGFNKKIKFNQKFKKCGERYTIEQNKLIVETKELYKLLDQDKVYSKAVERLDDSSSLLDALYIAASFYNCLFHCVKDTDEQKNEKEINCFIDELIEFVKWPYITLLKNIKITEEKDLKIIIQDRYKLLDINVADEDFEEENIDKVLLTIYQIQQASTIRKNKIDIDNISHIKDLKQAMKNK